MNHNIHELRAVETASIRAARHLLAEKGNAEWSAADQKQYDHLLDSAERARDERSRIDAQRYGVEVFVRKSDEQMTDGERMLVKNTMSTTTPNQGGYAVPSPVAAEIISNFKGPSPMRAAASQMFTKTGANFPYPTSDGTAEVGEQIAQNALASSLDPSFNSAPLTVWKYSSKVITMPIELLQDMEADPIEFVSTRAMERIGRIQNQKFTVGVGTTEPTGFVTAATVGKTGIAGQTTTIIYDDLVDLIESVDGNHPSLAFMMSQTMRAVVRKVKDTSGRPVYMPDFVDTGASPGGALLGFPVWVNNDMAVPAANAKSLAFGNFTKYMIRDAMEFTLFRFDDSAYKRLGQVAFLAWMRSGGNLLDTQAVKLYQNSAT